MHGPHERLPCHIGVLAHGPRRLPRCPSSRPVHPGTGSVRSGTHRGTLLRLREAGRPARYGLASILALTGGPGGFERRPSAGASMARSGPTTSSPDRPAGGLRVGCPRRPSARRSVPRPTGDPRARLWDLQWFRSNTQETPESSASELSGVDWPACAGIDQVAYSRTTTCHADASIEVLITAGSDSAARAPGSRPRHCPTRQSPSSPCRIPPPSLCSRRVAGCRGPSRSTRRSGSVRH
jgi:hypothetical protein